MNVEAICSRKYHAAHSGPGKRDPAGIKWIVLHDEEASSAESAARFFTTAEAEGSAHLCVDDNECYRTLSNDEIAWAAPSANREGFHIEQAGFAKWSVTTWLLHRNTLRRAAYKSAAHCLLFKLPPTFIWAPGLQRGEEGITTHAECTKAFGPVGGHTDPGLFWPRRLFMKYVRTYYAELSV